jgi:hypothetical protein
VQLSALVAVGIIGAVQLGRHRQSTSFSGDIFAGSSTSPGDYALAFYSGLWAYDGWLVAFCLALFSFLARLIIA